MLSNIPPFKYYNHCTINTCEYYIILNFFLPTAWTKSLEIHTDHSYSLYIASVFITEEPGYMLFTAWIHSAVFPSDFNSAQDASV